MSKRLALCITGCNECDGYLWRWDARTGKLLRCCGHAENRLIERPTEPRFAIPDWCPLSEWQDGGER